VHQEKTDAVLNPVDWDPSAIRDAAEEYTFHVRAADRAGNEAEAISRNTIIGKAIRVVDGNDGAPIPGASVWVRQTSSPWRSDGGADTNGDGLCAIPHMDVGDYAVEVDADGFSLSTFTLTITSKTSSELICRLPLSASVQGTIVGSIPNVGVFANQVDTAAPRDKWEVEAANGSFVIDDLDAPGTYHITAVAPGYADAVATVDVSPNDAATAPQLAPQKLATITGKVFAPGGTTPVMRCVVVAEGQTDPEWNWDSTVTEEDGSYLLYLRSDTSCRISVNHESFISPDPVLTALDWGETKTVNFTMAGAAPEAGNPASTNSTASAQSAGGGYTPPNLKRPLLFCHGLWSDHGVRQAFIDYTTQYATHPINKYAGWFKKVGRAWILQPGGDPNGRVFVIDFEKPAGSIQPQGDDVAQVLMEGTETAWFPPPALDLILRPEVTWLSPTACTRRSPILKKASSPSLGLSGRAML